MSNIRDARYAATTLILWILCQVAAPDAASAQGERYLPVAAMNAKLDSLERLALTGPTTDQRRSAVGAIIMAGVMTAPADGTPPPPYPGIVARLIKVYRQSDDYGVRYSIIVWATQQAERGEAVALLIEAAQEAPAPGAGGGGIMAHDVMPTLPQAAIGALAEMGPEGEAALRRLHAQGTVQEPMARRYLGKLAGQGFRKQSGS